MSVEKVHQNYPFFYKNIDFSIKKHIKVVIFFDNGIKHQWIKIKEKQIMIYYFLMFDVCFGTVFQTAFLLAFMIPRLHPGLLSLRSV